jgi:uncharacterized protein YdeI (YjbR/CyaY-like superfamily)
MMPTKTFTPPSFQPKTRAEWREWLVENHATSKGIHLILIKKGADIAGIMYDEAVEEALCFGWIDSTPAKLDAQRYKLYISPRKPGSVWSNLNKQRIRKLVKERKMTPAGLVKIEAAKKDGSWSQLDEIDRLFMPADLLEQLSANPDAKRNFEAFSTSSKKTILFWIASARRDETRRKRIGETVRLAARNIKAAHYRQ